MRRMMVETPMNSQMIGKRPPNQEFDEDLNVLIWIPLIGNT